MLQLATSDVVLFLLSRLRSFHSIEQSKLDEYFFSHFINIVFLDKKNSVYNAKSYCGWGGGVAAGVT